jgi:hypothetical protein
MSSRGAIGWADAIIAAKELGLRTNADLTALVKLLGLTLAGVGASADEPTPETAVPAIPSSQSGDDWTTTHPIQPDVETAPDRRTVVDVLERRAVEPWAGDADPLDPPPIRDPAVMYEPPILETQLRAAVAALVQRVRRSVHIDVPAAVELVARQRPLEPVPRLDELTTRRGAIVVADVGPSMSPYLADVDRFVAEVAHVVGSPNMTVVWWDGEEFTPTRADNELFVRPGVPTVVISTLGAVESVGARLSQRAHWLKFADTAQSVEADLVALVPHRLQSWPQAIARTMHIVAWDDLPLVGRGRG